MLDTNVYDRIVADEAFLTKLIKAHNDGKIVVLETHVQRDELARISDDAKRALVKRVPGVKIVTSGMVWDVSRFDEGTFGDGAGDVCVSDLLTPAGNSAQDALITATSSYAADVLVTEDKRIPKRVRATNSKLAVWNFDRFKAYVEAL